MSNQEAIALLRNLEDALDSYCELNEEGKTAFRMAIEALSRSENPNNSDCISRQAAIDEVVAWLKDRMSDKKNGKPLTERLRDLPSAQPEIIRCKDCKHYKTIGAFGTTLRKKDYWCDAENFPDEGQKELPEWWFCAGAERREE